MDTHSILKLLLMLTGRKQCILTHGLGLRKCCLQTTFVRCWHCRGFALKHFVCVQCTIWIWGFYKFVTAPLWNFAGELAFNFLYTHAFVSFIIFPMIRLCTCVWAHWWLHRCDWVCRAKDFPCDCWTLRQSRRELGSQFEACFPGFWSLAKGAKTAVHTGGLDTWVGGLFLAPAGAYFSNFNLKSSKLKNS